MHNFSITSPRQRFIHKHINAMKKLTETHLNAEIYAKDVNYTIAEEKMYSYMDKQLKSSSVILKSAKKAFKYYKKKYGQEGVSKIAEKYTQSLPFMRLRVFQRLIFSTDELLDRYVDNIAELVLKNQSGAKIINMIK